MPGDEPPTDRARARGLGIVIGLLPPGPLNAITDVAGVRVGHATVWWGEPPGAPGQGPARTGVTAIWPGDDLGQGAVPAGHAILSGTGEMTGLAEIAELGRIDTPIVLTNTMGVGIAYHATCVYLIERDPSLIATRAVAIPVVGECDDGRLNDAYGLHVTAAHVVAALDAASPGPVPEGAVGAGAGMTCFDFKGGIGTSSRVVPEEAALRS